MAQRVERQTRTPRVLGTIPGVRPRRLVGSDRTNHLNVRMGTFDVNRYTKEVLL